MEKVRGFEIAKGFEGKGINLPERKTKNSAAYDIEAAEDVVIPSFKKGMKPTLVATGLKAYMQEDEVLYLYAKNYWREFYRGNPNDLILELKEKLRPQVFDSLYKIYTDLKDKLN